MTGPDNVSYCPVMTARLPALLALLLSLGSCGASERSESVRVATFNIGMGMTEAGELAAALADPEHPKLRKVAELIQRIRPDVILLNEVDYDPGVDAAALLQSNFLFEGSGRERAYRIRIQPPGPHQYGPGQRHGP